MTPVAVWTAKELAVKTWKTLHQWAPKSTVCTYSALSSRTWTTDLFEWQKNGGGQRKFKRTFTFPPLTPSLYLLSKQSLRLIYSCSKRRALGLGLGGKVVVPRMDEANDDDEGRSRRRLEQRKEAEEGISTFAICIKRLHATCSSAKGASKYDIHLNSGHPPLVSLQNNLCILCPQSWGVF